MSSVQRFLKQRTTGATTFSAPSSLQLYQFIAGPAASATNQPLANANYVGNYPPGYLIAGPTVGDLAAAAAGGVLNPVLRDMGKTIKGSLASDVTGATLYNAGFWREVQVLSPVAVSGPTASTNNGITGSGPGLKPAGNSGDAGYNTYYIPIEVNGVVPANSSGAIDLASSYPSLIPGNVL